MKKIIRLTESDLTRIVNRVIREQQQIITNYDNKYDYKKDGGNFFYKLKNSNKWIKAEGEPLNAIKTRVYKINNLDSKNKKNLNVVTNNTTDSQKYTKFLPKNDVATIRDTTDPWSKKLKEYAKYEVILKNMKKDESSWKKIPIHVRACIDFILGRTKVWTDRDFTQKELDDLRPYILTWLSQKRDRLDYEWWYNQGASDTPTAKGPENIKKEFERIGNTSIKSLINPNMASKFKYFFGRLSGANIKYDPKTDVIQIFDNYDFNVTEHDKGFDEVVKDAATAINLWTKDKGTTYGVIRNLVAFRELTGYGGFPVKLVF